jgi:cation:H+ antiporter
VRIDVPVMVAMSVALLLLSLDGSLGAIDCLLLLAGLVGYLTLSVVVGRREAARGPRTLAAEPVPAGSTGGRPRPLGPAGRNRPASGEPPAEPAAQGPAGPRALHHLVNLGLVAAGVAALVVGAGWLVEGATRIATELGIPDVVIGLTIVAIGTSLPELTTTIIAAIRGERDLAIGNAVGSNIANIGAVLGIAGLLQPGGIPVPSSVLNFDLPVMVAVAVALLPIVYTGYAIRRWEGVLFLGLYGSYMGYLLLNATDHERLPAFSAVMLWFVLPIVAISLGTLAGYDAGLRRGRAEGRARDQMLSGGE